MEIDFVLHVEKLRIKFERTLFIKTTLAVLDTPSICIIYTNFWWNSNIVMNWNDLEMLGKRWKGFTFNLFATQTIFVELHTWLNKLNKYLTFRINLIIIRPPGSSIDTVGESYKKDHRGGQSWLAFSISLGDWVFAINNSVYELP